MKYYSSVALLLLLLLFQKTIIFILNINIHILLFSLFSCKKNLVKNKIRTISSKSFSDLGVALQP